MKCSLGICIVLKRSLVFPILLFSSISLHWLLRKAFLSFFAILWNSAFKWVYLSFSPLPFTSLLFTAICKVNRVLPRELTRHSKHPLPTTQEKTLPMDITRWPTQKSDWLYSLQPNGEALIPSAKTRPGADYGSDHELLAKFRLKLKKVGKTTRPFRYDLHQIPYDYTREVRIDSRD